MYVRRQKLRFVRDRAFAVAGIPPAPKAAALGVKEHLAVEASRIGALQRSVRRDDRIGVGSDQRVPCVDVHHYVLRPDRPRVVAHHLNLKVQPLRVVCGAPGAKDNDVNTMRSRRNDERVEAVRQTHSARARHHTQLGLLQSTARHWS